MNNSLDWLHTHTHQVHFHLIEPPIVFKVDEKPVSLHLLLTLQESHGHLYPLIKLLVQGETVHSTARPSGILESSSRQMDLWRFCGTRPSSKGETAHPRRQQETTGGSTRDGGTLSLPSMSWHQCELPERRSPRSKRTFSLIDPSPITRRELILLWTVWN